MVHIINTSLSDDLLSVEFSIARPVYISLVAVKSTCALFKVLGADTLTSHREWMLLNRNDLSTFLGQQITNPLKDMMIEQAISSLIVKVRLLIPLDPFEDEEDNE